MHFRAAIVVAACLAGAGAHAVQADHLLLSEVAVDTVTESSSASSEYVEIFNPTDAAIALDQYYITDHASYFDLVSSPDGQLDTGASDTIIRFPSGASIPSGGVVVVSRDAATFLGEFFSANLSSFTSQPGAPQLFEVAESDASVANMVVLNKNASGGATTFSRTNGGEFVVLFQWDGTTDLVSDVDVVMWGNPTGGNRFTAKTALPVDGPDADTVSSAYQADNGDANLSVAANVDLITRVSIDETSETLSGGNGITGHDESMENCAVTWAASLALASDATPGTTLLPVAGGNLVPEISGVTRNLQYPGPSDTVTISASLQDSDGTIASARVYVDSGSGFASTDMTQVGATNVWSAAIGSFADETYVKYYVEATDNATSSVTYPVSAPAALEVFLVDDAPVTGDDVVINEIMYNVPGADSPAPEFVELHNRRSTPVKLGHFAFLDAIDANLFILPEDAEIPAEGYLVLTQDEPSFNAKYTTEPVTNLIDWGTFQLNNGGDTPNLIHVNAFRWNETSIPFDQVSYLDVAPWPTAPAGTGPSLELRNPAFDNSQASSWAASAEEGGTPGLENSATFTAAADWQMFE